MKLSIFRPDPGPEANALDVCVTEFGVTILAIEGGKPRSGYAMTPELARTIAEQLARAADAAEAFASIKWPDYGQSDGFDDVSSPTPGDTAS